MNGGHDCETNPARERQPRSAARRAQVGARIGGVLEEGEGAQSNCGANSKSSRHEGIPQEILATRPPRNALPAPQAWEDTSTHLAVPEQVTFFSKQPRVFWAAAAALLVALFTVISIIGYNAWKEAEAARAEARRLKQLAEEKAKYKLLYRDLIEPYSAEAGIDPALVAAVIYHESRFDPDAVSRVGARGLMQIMDDTGEWIAGKLGEKSHYTKDSLFNPETNIRFGTWYLGFLSRMFDGNLVKIAASYHAGQNRVIGWLQNEAYSSDGVTLEHIPFEDTDQYVKRVVSAYEIYTRHYYTKEEPEGEGAS